jgi:hypothetical protein
MRFLHSIVAAALAGLVASLSTYCSAQSSNETIGSYTQYNTYIGNPYAGYTTENPVWFMINPDLPTPYLYMPMGNTSSYTFVFDYENGNDTLVPVYGRAQGYPETALYYYDIIDCGPLGTVDGSVFTSDTLQQLNILSPPDLQNVTIFTTSTMFMLNFTEQTADIYVIYQSEGPLAVTIAGPEDDTYPSTTLQLEVGDAGQEYPTYIDFNFTDGNIYRISVVYQYQNLSSDFATLYMWEWSLATGYLPTENFPVVMNANTSEATGGSLYTAGFDSTNSGTVIYGTADCGGCSLVGWDFIVFPTAMNMSSVQNVYPELYVAPVTGSNSTNTTYSNATVPPTTAPTAQPSTAVDASVSLFALVAAFTTMVMNM